MCRRRALSIKTQIPGHKSHKDIERPPAIVPEGVGPSNKAEGHLFSFEVKCHVVLNLYWDLKPVTKTSQQNKINPNHYSYLPKQFLFSHITLTRTVFLTGTCSLLPPSLFLSVFLSDEYDVSF